MAKNILSILGGFIAGILVIVAIDALGYKLYGPDEFVDYTDKAAIRLFIHGFPFQLYLFMCFSIFFGSITAGFVASQIHFEEGESNSIITGVLLFISIGIYLFLFPHPMWFWLVSLMTCVPLSYLGYFIDSSYLYKDTIA